MSDLLIINLNAFFCISLVIVIAWLSKKYPCPTNSTSIVILFVGFTILMALGFILEELIDIKNYLEAMQ